MTLNKNPSLRVKRFKLKCRTLVQKELTMSKDLLLKAIDDNNPEQCAEIIRAHFWSLKAAEQGNWLGLREQGLSLFEYAASKKSLAALEKLVFLAIASIHIYPKANYVYLPNMENPLLPLLHVLAFARNAETIKRAYALIEHNLPVGALAEAMKLARKYENKTALEIFQSLLVGPRPGLFSSSEIADSGRNNVPSFS